MLIPLDISKVHNGIVSLGHEEKQLFSPLVQCVGVGERHVGGLAPAVAVARPHIESDKHTMNGNHSQC